MTGNTVIRHGCPRGCGWYRDTGHGRDLYKDEPPWDYRVITHPRHGTVSNSRAAELDIEQHDCAEYHEAIRRLQSARRVRAAA